MPQRIINLGAWEFVSFVQGNLKHETNDKQIILLIKNTQTEETKIINIRIDPWKRIDRTKPFKVPERVFVIEGSVARPPKTALPREFSDDKIKCI